MIELGSVVRLKSGGPAMAVCGLVEGDNNFVRCMWLPPGAAEPATWGFPRCVLKLESECTLSQLSRWDAIFGVQDD